MPIVLHVYREPPLLSASCALTPLVPTMSPRARHCNDSHFTDEKSEDRRARDLPVFTQLVGAQAAQDATLAFWLPALALAHGAPWLWVRAGGGEGEARPRGGAVAWNRSMEPRSV